MKKDKLFYILFLSLALFIHSGCGGGGGDRGITTTNVSTGRVNVSGIVLAPAGVQGARSASRESEAASADEPLPGATVSLARMLGDGTLAVIDLPQVPKGENYVLTAVKSIPSGETLTSRKVFSITEGDVEAVNVNNVAVDAGTTLAAEGFRQIITALNDGLGESEQIKS
ncbi:MAG TPA: hypothetical protein PLQ76_07350, partial [bacterium]|nr:hypothetical protein [bacterium]